MSPCPILCSDCSDTDGRSIPFSSFQRIFALLLSIPTVVHTRHLDVSDKVGQDNYWVCDSGESVTRLEVYNTEFTPTVL